MTVTVKEQGTTFPPPSVAVIVLVVLPVGNTPPDAIPAVCEIVTWAGQLSVKVVLENVATASQLPGALDTEIFAGQDIVGEMVSNTKMLTSSVAEQPLTSETVNV